MLMKQTDATWLVCLLLMLFYDGYLGPSEGEREEIGSIIQQHTGETSTAEVDDMQRNNSRAWSDNEPYGPADSLHIKHVNKGQ